MGMILNYIGYVGSASIVINIFFAFIAIFAWIKGIFPALFRLGNGLAKRKIAIFAGNAESLKSLLLDSKLFKAKNIVNITNKNDLERAENITLYLVDWASFSKEIDSILKIKSDKTALIIYAPPNSIPPEKMNLINGKRNAIVTNFRGRLLNDIIVSLITVSYEKK